MAGLLTIGEVSARSGVSPSALRFYEAHGLIGSVRSAGNQRRFSRDVLRRVAIIQVLAGSGGVSLRTLADLMGCLPVDRAPSAEEWSMLADRLAPILDDRIDALGSFQAEVVRLAAPTPAQGR